MKTDILQNKVFSKAELYDISQEIKQNGIRLGFQQVGIADTDLGEAEERFEKWLAEGCHGDMDYLSRHGKKRSRPERLVPGTVRVISARMVYWPTISTNTKKNLSNP